MGSDEGDTGESLPVPESLADQLAAAQAGDTVELTDSIYAVDRLTVPAGVTLQAASGARPIVMRADGRAPTVVIGDHCTVDGIWFGGTLKDDVMTGWNVLDDAVVRSCTFFNYYGVIAEGGHTRIRYQGNRFVNCGTGSYYHGIYISNSLALPGEGAQIVGNLFLGGEGYQIHLWHNPANTAIRNNFSGDAQWSLVLNGPGHVAERNIIWGSRGTAGARLSMFFSPGAYRFDGNLIGPHCFDGAWANPAGCTATGNAFVAPRKPFGDKPLAWQEGDVLANLGRSSAEIDAAIAAIEKAFAGTVAEIHADQSIEGNFAVLADVLARWAAV